MKSKLALLVASRARRDGDARRALLYIRVWRVLRGRERRAERRKQARFQQKSVPDFSSGDGVHFTPKFFGARSGYGTTGAWRESPLSARAFYDLFRFARRDISVLCRALGIPAVFSGPDFCLDGEEALLIYLRRLSYPCRLFDLQVLFQRSLSQISKICSAMTTFLDEIAIAYLDEFDGELWAPYVPDFARAIADAGAPLKMCWAFVDGTFRRCCRPSDDGPTGDLQRAYYSGYKRLHGSEFQCVVAPNGMFVEVHGPFAARTNDKRMMRESGLLDRLENFHHDDLDVEYFCLYGDCGYTNHPYTIVPYPKTTIMLPQRRRFNEEMASVRVSVEQAFAKVVSLFAFVDFAKTYTLDTNPSAPTIVLPLY